VLCAFDKFKGALGAERASELVAEVIGRKRPGWAVDVAPLTDGGDGFCTIMTTSAGGQLHEVIVTRPLFESATPAEPPREAGESGDSAPPAPRRAVSRAAPLRAPVGMVELADVPASAQRLLGLGADVRRLAVVEMASASGLALVPRERVDVFWSSSFGTGELLLAAQALGADAILLGVGGSATSDLGLGALAALGLRFESGSGVDLGAPVPAQWPALEVVRGRIHPRLPPLLIACDVDNPTFGPRGAAAVFGPQKGLCAEDLPRFEADAERVAALLCQALGADSSLLELPGAGAAGGIAFGLMAATGARLVPGFELVSAWLGLEERVRAADWVLTGEGRLDASSWTGKGPGALVRLARSLERRAVVFAGAIADGAAEAAEAAGSSGCELIAISDPSEPLEHVVAASAENLERSVEHWLGRAGADSGPEGERDAAPRGEPNSEPG
jgi:glycerate 2-kinase